MMVSRTILFGIAAGAAGTTALNAVTYLDMAVRARPVSNTPQETVERLAAAVSVPIPGEGEERDNRLAGLGPLSGIATGVAVGALLGATRALGWRMPLTVGGTVAAALAMAAANLPMSALGVTDLRTWSLTDWVSDVVPHLAYGGVTVATLRALSAE